MKGLLELAEEKGYQYQRPIEDTNNYLRACLVQRWLREEHGIIVDVYYNEATPESHVYECDIFKIGKASVNQKGGTTYEEALQKGIEEGLKLI